MLSGWLSLPDILLSIIFSIGSFELNIQNVTSFIRYFEDCIKNLK
jgi:hypothetical protein